MAEMIRLLHWTGRALLALIELASIFGFVAMILAWILLTNGSLPV